MSQEEKKAGWKKKRRSWMSLPWTWWYGNTAHRTLQLVSAACLQSNREEHLVQVPPKEHRSSRFQKHSLAAERDPRHFNTYCTPPCWRTKVTAALRMLSYTIFILIQKYSGCPNVHMWILGVKSRHRDYNYKTWSLKPLRSTWSSSLLHENVLKKDLFVAHSFSVSRCNFTSELRKSR